ncbi:MAG: hypothetical protein IH784_06770 [Bacteroidetes bacterium]|nr:hypothetical protein [Bacteroidota bacterium]
MVKDIVGKEADDFETLARRYLSDQPIARQTFSNKIKAIFFMIRAMLLPTWDMEKFEKERGFPKFQNMMFSSESDEWRNEHNVSQLEQV